MAKTDNLTDFLTDIADAIREKKGTTGAINPQDFSSEIASIESGGGGGGGSVVTSVPMSDVNFYDYDGTILYSYTKEQFLALSTMPELPTREGLICQGWNYRWGEAVSYVTDYGKLNIGAMYITDDGDTRLYIRIATEGRMTVPLYWSQTVSGGVGIDWGDGSAIQSVSGTGNKNTTHTYANPGDYVIRLKVANDCTLGLGQSSYSILGITANESTDATIYAVYRNMLRHVEIGRNVTQLEYAFSTCINLESITIPNDVTGKLNFRKNYSLKFITIPQICAEINCYFCSSMSGIALSNGVRKITSSAFYCCYKLEHITIPKSITSISSHTFSTCHDLKSVIIPNSVTSIGDYAFEYNYTLTKIIIPNSVTSMGKAVFTYCYGLISFTCFDSISTIKSQTFYFCSGMAIYDFTHHTSVPTLENIDAFTNIPSDCVIKVPSSLLSAWKSATNWSTYASKIVAG